MRWTPRRLIALALVVGAVTYWLSPWRADAALIHGATRHVAHVRVVNVEPDNGRTVMYSLNNGAAYVVHRPGNCRLQHRPRMCRTAYRILRRHPMGWAR